MHGADWPGNLDQQASHGRDPTIDLKIGYAFEGTASRCEAVLSDFLHPPVLINGSFTGLINIKQAPLGAGPARSEERESLVRVL
jgi:hypothetical protein